VAIAPIGYEHSDAVRVAADRLHDELDRAGIEVLLDDRGERPGVMFADFELIGIPHRLTVGDRGLKDGKVEYQGRRETEPTAMPLAEAAALLRSKIRC
jgi:prolyl-tRNA synthetase